MTDDEGKRSPTRVPVTGEFLAETTARRNAYEAGRRLWTSAFHPSEPRAQPAVRSRSRGKIHDPRQGRFDL